MLSQWVVAGALAAGLCAPPAWAVEWQVKDLGPLASVGGVTVSGLNNLGQVIGWTNVNQSFLAGGAPPVLLPLLSGGTTMRALDINDAGQVVGSADAAGIARGFLYAGGTSVDLGTLGGGAADRSVAHAINEAGDVAGASYLHLPNGIYTVRGMLVQGGTRQQLPTFASVEKTGLEAAAASVDASGRVVGVAWSSAYAVDLFSWQGGGLANLTGGVDDQRWSAIKGNDAGDLLGYVSGHAWIFGAGGSRVDIGSLGAGSTMPTDFNALGQVVGFSAASSSELHAFVYRDGAMTDLSTLPALTALGSVNTFVYTNSNIAPYVRPFVGVALNDLGEVALTVSEGDGLHLVLATPVPEPGPAALWAAGLAVLVLLLHRRQPA